jgi:hypothetical protein
MDLSYFRKSLWKKQRGPILSFFCPFCGIPRKVASRSQPGGLIHYFQILLTSFIFTLLCWSWFSWKGMVSFVPFWTVFDAGYRLRLRAKLPCQNCGFDPYLFQSDMGRARQEVEAHWKRKFAEKGIPYPELNSGSSEK